jgi:tetratricopeptide (TPR) repeat protein
VELDGIALIAGDTADREALDHLSQEGFSGDSAWYHFWKAEWWHWRGRPDSVQAHCDSARILYERALRDRPNDAETHHFLANIYAGLGRPSDAIREAERALALVPESTDAITGAHFRWTLALILTRTGRGERAVEELAHLLAEPSVVSRASLRADPTWAPLRALPRFQTLMAQER